MRFSKKSSASAERLGTGTQFRNSRRLPTTKLSSRVYSLNSFSKEPDSYWRDYSFGRLQNRLNTNETDGNDWRDHRAAWSPRACSAGVHHQSNEERRHAWRSQDPGKRRNLTCDSADSQRGSANRGIGYGGRRSVSKTIEVSLLSDLERPIVEKLSTAPLIAEHEQEERLDGNSSA